ncbi:c-type cytochrome [Neorhizobium alkalisoli]|uniref:Cytochrome c n=1 Tax=Neorhizobium alkalisoli TaxID=528178 RepID=A0A561R372_9HYPH|nr:cytochrome c family protein [Neorhizobium alkalisoli]TWF57049.1 cytochrome c [Neorhizobium alkalisoli]
MAYEMIFRPLMAAVVYGTLCLGTATLTQAADAAHGQQVFRQCSACHSADTATNKVGPSLKGVVGRHAGAVADYKYSKALTDAGTGGTVWDDATLGAFLASPRKAMPGTRMSFFGLSKQADIDDVIEYLKSNP